MFDEPKCHSQDSQKIDKIINVVVGNTMYHIDVEYSAWCPMAIKTNNFQNHIACGLSRSSCGKFKYLCDPQNCPLDGDVKKSFDVELDDDNCLDFYLFMLGNLGWNIDERLTICGEWGTKKILSNRQTMKCVPFSFHSDFEFGVKLMYFYIGLNDANVMKELSEPKLSESKIKPPRRKNV